MNTAHAKGVADAIRVIKSMGSDWPDAVAHQNTSSLRNDYGSQFEQRILEAFPQAKEFVAYGSRNEPAGKTRIDPEYVNRLSLHELRRELAHALEVKYGLLDALRDMPVLPDPFVLHHLAHAAKWPEDSNRGKELQREHGLDAIPPVSECELGAGLWDRIRPH